MADDDPTTETPDPAPTGSATDPLPTDPPADPARGGDDVDRIKSESRKHEDRHKREKAAREKAEAAKADAETARKAAEQGLEKLREDFAAALGFKSDDSPDPAALQQTVTEREARIASLEADNRAKDVELAAWRSASRHEANAVALLDSRSFLESVSELDPTGDDFGTALDAAVAAALEANPALKTVVPGPRAPKPDPSQGSGRPAPATGAGGAAEAERRFGKTATT